MRSIFSRKSLIGSLLKRECNYLSKDGILNEASSLTKIHFKSEEYDWYSPGIRSQLFDKQEKKLLMDFKCEIVGNTVHLLNSVSPSWTCAFVTASMVTYKLEELGIE